MNSVEAQFILRAYRPGGQDAADPQFAEALALARQDPELARWLAAETALDAAIGRKLRSVEVPADLPAMILAGRKIIEPVGWWQRRVHPLAAVAALALTFAALGYLGVRQMSEQRANLKLFSAELTEYLGKGYGPLLQNQSRRSSPAQDFFGTSNYKMNFRSVSLEEVRHWLEENGGHPDFYLPAGLKYPRNLGCAVIGWRGRRASVVCFQVGPNLPTDKVHLVAIPSADLPDPPTRGVPRFEEYPGSTVALWSDGPLTYLLMAPGDSQSLASRFAPASLQRPAR